MNSEGSCEEVVVSELPRFDRMRRGLRRGLGASENLDASSASSSPPPRSSDARVSPRWARASSRWRSRAPASLGREGPCGGASRRASRVGSLISTCFPGVSRGAPHARPGPLREPTSVGDAVGPCRCSATPASSAGESPPCLPRVARGTRPTTTSRTSWRASGQFGSPSSAGGEAWSDCKAKSGRFLDLVDRTVDCVSWMRVRASHIATLYYLDVCERVELDQSDERHLPLDDLPVQAWGVEVVVEAGPVRRR